MTFLRIVLSSLVTAALAAVTAGLLSFLCALVSKPNQGAVGEGVAEAAGAAIVAGLAGLVLGAVGAFLFPASF